MKKSITILFVFLVSVSVGDVKAQFSIRHKQTQITDKVDPLLGNVGTDITNEYFDRTAWLAERKKQRNERNDVEFNAKLQTSLQQFENWAAGGQNNFSFLATVDFSHKFHKDKFQSVVSINSRYGMNVVDDRLYKNVDEFKFEARMSWTMRSNWSYSGTVKFRTQFADGYKSRTDSTLVSAFMSPGYLDAALGFTYSKKGLPFTVTLSPLSGSMVTVINSELSKQGKYGVEAGRTTLNKIGPSVDVTYDNTFGKKKSVRYRSKFYTFTNFETAPTVRWENTVDLNITKFLTTTFYSAAYYFKSSSTALQYQFSTTVGLSYRFANK